MYHLVSKRSWLIVGSYDSLEAALNHHDDFEIIDDDERERRLVAWAEREEVDIDHLHQDEDGDLYKRVHYEDEDYYERNYVEYVALENN